MMNCIASPGAGGAQEEFLVLSKLRYQAAISD
jgi:hypothetical protein